VAMFSAQRSVGGAVRGGRHAIRNVMTVDVEDYYQVSAFQHLVSRERWSDYESRVVSNTSRLLDLFAEAKIEATFFVLGWVAERHKDLVARIARNGHHVASHSYWHRLVYDLTPAEFRDDLRRARDILESAAGAPVRGFRAPSYSITRESLWALDVLIEEGYAYDASIFPIRHDRYGIPDAPRQPHVVKSKAGSLLEVPSTAGRVGSLAVPIGGGFFRLFPYRVTRWAIDQINESGQPAIFYIHPWEIDPDQPRLDATLPTRLRHYNNLGQAEERLRRLLRDFRFGSIESVVLAPTASAGAVA
jgi:polysaccharide deacetylase family protein (PEP-CTERM system associated)